MAQTADRNIRIVSSSTIEERLSFQAQLDGKPADLFCSKLVPECVMVEPGEYLLVDAPADKQLYADCFNVYLYSYDKSHQRDKKIGLYCLLP